MNLRSIILVLFITKNSSILALSIPSLSPYLSECYEELGLRYIQTDVVNELLYNHSCIAKCVYEKEGKLDPNGNFVLSQFPSENSEAITECLGVITATDICKKAANLESCVTRKTDPYWIRYGKCDKFISYDDDYDDMKTYCYHRCQLILEDSLYENGSINFDRIYTFNPFDEDEVVENCSKIIIDEDDCIRNLNLYQCVNYLVNHYSEEVLKAEVECAREYNRYSFPSVNYFDDPHTCYQRCVLIKTGELDEYDFKKSDFIKYLGTNETALDEAIETCKITTMESDECDEDLYLYDCVKYILKANPEDLKKEKECALQTNSPLLPYRQPYKEYYCKKRCLMIKEGQLDDDGVVDRNHLKLFSYNDTIIDKVVSECNAKRKNITCIDDINAYNCTTTKITQIVNELCKFESRGNRFCVTRCVYSHEGQLSPEGEVTVDAFLYGGGNVTAVEEVINSCKSRIAGSDECERVISHYNCVNLIISTIIF